MAYKIFAFLLTLSPVFALAQGFSVSGNVIGDEDKQEVVGATILLTNVKDSTDQHYTASGVDGTFTIKKLASAFYKMRITSVGFQPYEQFLRVSEQDVKLGALTLTTDTKLLSEVEIKGEVVPVQQKGDTTQMSAQAYKTNPDASAEDLIKKMPGILVKTDGTVQAQGEDVKKVLVDGREFFSNDPSVALKNLPAEIIDKIEVFDQKSEQAQFSGFDDGNTTKTINIVTKPNMRNGMFGRVYAGAGDNGYYGVGGNINKFDSTRRISILGLANNVNQQNFSNEDLLGVMSSGGSRRGPRGGGGGNSFFSGQQSGISQTQSFGINYDEQVSKKLKINGSYFFNRSDNSATQYTSRETFLTSDSSQFYNENSISGSINNNHRLSMRLEYEIDDNNSLLFRPNLSFQNNDATTNQAGITKTEAGNAITETNSMYNSDRNGYNFSGSLLYKHKFNKKGRTFSLDINSSMSDNEGDATQVSVNNYYLKDQLDSINQYSDSDTKGKSIGANAVYTEPIGENSQLELNYGWSKSFNDADKETFSSSSAEEELILNPSLSNKFESTYTTNSPSVGYSYRKDKLMLRGDVAYQHASLSNDQDFPLQNAFEKSFESILPGFMLRYKMSRSKRFMLFLRTNTNAPSISQLQNVVDNSDPLFLSAGNPDLKQATTNSIRMHYSNHNSEKSSSFFVMAMADRTSNYVASRTFVADADSVLTGGVVLNEGAQLTTPTNVDGYWNVRAFSNYGFPVEALKSNLNSFFGITYNRKPGYTNNNENISNSYNVNAGVTLASNISENVDFTLSYRADYTLVNNSLQTSNEDDYISHTVGLSTSYIFLNGFVWRNNFNYLKYSGYTDDALNTSYVLWNASVGKKFMKSDRAELALSVYDLLKQNTNISRNNTETYFEEVRTNALQRYFMLTFIYNIRSFGNNGSSSNDRGDRPPGPPPGAGGRGPRW